MSWEKSLLPAEHVRYVTLRGASPFATTFRACALMMKTAARYHYHEPKVAQTAKQVPHPPLLRGGWEEVPLTVQTVSSA